MGIADAAGAICETLTYDPYGQVLARTTSPYTPRNRVGHQGLFFDKLDGIGGAAWPDHPSALQLVPHARGVYQNVNRGYAPQHGRFLQRDPNASGQPLALAMAMHGSGHPWGFGALSVPGMYGDGMSLYGYLRGDPLGGHDPLGLSLNPLSWKWTKAVLSKGAAAGVFATNLAKEIAVEAALMSMGIADPIWLDFLSLRRMGGRAAEVWTRAWSETRQRSARGRGIPGVPGWFIPNERFREWKHFQHTFDRHAAEFGITGDKSPETVAMFTAVLESVITTATDSRTVRYKGKTDSIVRVYWNSRDRRAVIVSEGNAEGRAPGAIVSAYIIKDFQIERILTRGEL